LGADEAAQHIGRSRLGHDDSGQDQGAAAPAEKPEPVVGEEVAEEARPHSLEREDEGDPGGADAPLRPDLDQVAQRAREDPRDDEGSPYRPAARDRELAERHRDEQKTEERAVTISTSVSATASCREA
jgi:hypothetical protein